jgi:hypothetical protein
MIKIALPYLTLPLSRASFAETTPSHLQHSECHSTTFLVDGRPEQPIHRRLATGMTGVFLLLLLCGTLAAQTTTTYTLTQNSCAGTANQYCLLPTDGGTFTMDNRAPSRLGYLEFPNGTWIHGAYSGLVSNPDGTRNPFYGTAHYLSDNGTVTATLNFYAHYVSTCSGRGCGGTLGWHYTFLTGSVIETK